MHKPQVTKTQAYLKEKKTDTLDASILANLLIDGKFPLSQTPQDQPFIEIRQLSRRSSRYAEQIAIAKTRLKDELAQASVGMLRVFDKQAVFNKAPMHLMTVYPLPTDRLAAGVDAVARLLAKESNNKYGKAFAEKLLGFDAKNQGDERLCDYFRQSIRDYIEEIQYLKTKQEQYVTRMEAQTKELKPAQHLLSLPGCGRKLMPIILGEAGTMDRFSAADRFVGYAGLAPIEHESGPYKGEKHLKKGGSPRLSYACYMIANCARRKDDRLNALYQRVKERHLLAGKPKGIAHIIANCAVAREIAVLIYWILKDNRPYFKEKADLKAYRAQQKSGANPTGGEIMYPHAELTEKIIAAAIEVHTHLGPAYHEGIYQVALAHELTLRGLPFEREKELDVSYKGISVGKFRLDFLVDDRVVLELKSVSALSDVHLSQMLSYLAATGKKVGLLINFAQAKLVDGIKRVVL